MSDPLPLLTYLTLTMRIPKPPYHNVTNDLLYGILMGGDCKGYQNLVVGAAAVSLSVPENTLYALLVVEADPTSAEKAKVIRFKEFDTITNPPTATVGIPLGDLSIYEVKGVENLLNFKVIGIEAGKVHSIKIQYFG